MPITLQINTLTGHYHNYVVIDTDLQWKLIMNWCLCEYFNYHNANHDANPTDCKSNQSSFFHCPCKFMDVAIYSYEEMELSLALVFSFKIYIEAWFMKIYGIKMLNNTLNAFHRVGKMTIRMETKAILSLKSVSLNSLGGKKAVNFPSKFTWDSVNAPTPSDNVISLKWKTNRCSRINWRWRIRKLSYEKFSIQMQKDFLF